MGLMEFYPENDLERDIISTKDGKLSIEHLLENFVRSEIYISSKSEVMHDGRGFAPLLLGQGKYPLVAVFSSLDRPGLHREMASYILKMSGSDFVRRMSANHGIAINPGYAAQLSISAEVVLGLKVGLICNQKS